MLSALNGQLYSVPAITVSQQIITLKLTIYILYLKTISGNKTLSIHFEGMNIHVVTVSSTQAIGQQVNQFVKISMQGCCMLKWL